MIANKRKLQLAMARACMSVTDVQKKAQMPRPTLDNAIAGKDIRPETLGRIAKALGVDPVELID